MPHEYQYGINTTELEVQQLFDTASSDLSASSVEFLGTDYADVLNPIGIQSDLEVLK